MSWRACSRCLLFDRAALILLPPEITSDINRTRLEYCSHRPTARPAGISWDETNLQTNEAEKVPRMKIDEPKTPFLVYNDGALLCLST